MVFPPGTKWHIFESPNRVLKSISDFIFYKVIAKTFISEGNFNLLQKWLWKIFLAATAAAADTKNGAVCVDSSSKRDKDFIIVCVTFTHNMPRRIRCYNVKEVWTYCSWQNIYKQGPSRKGIRERHHLRCMTKNKNHDSLAWENPAKKCSQRVLISFYYCGVFAACCRQCLDPAAG